MEALTKDEERDYCDWRYKNGETVVRLQVNGPLTPGVWAKLNEFLAVIAPAAPAEGEHAGGRT